MRYYVYKFVKGYMYKRVENPETGCMSLSRADMLRDELLQESIEKQEKCTYTIIALPRYTPAPDSLMVIENPIVKE